MALIPNSTMNNSPTALGQDVTAVLYLRVSSSGQVNKAFDPEGYSIPGQREACERHAERLGARKVGEFIEPGRTGTNMQRAGLQKMLGELPHLKPTYVIVYDLSRVARDDFDALWLLREIEGHGCKLESTLERVDDTPAGKLLYTVMAGVNAFRSRGDAEKVKMGLERKHLAGGSSGPARIGYLNGRTDVGGRSVAVVDIDPIRSPLVTLAFDVFATGDYTLTTLVELLDEAGLRTRATRKRPSRPLGRTALHRMLRNDYYIGIVTLNGVKVRGTHTPLVDEEVFARVQSILDAHRASGDRSQKHSHYLSGSIYWACGRRLGYGRHRSKSGAYYEYFSCLSRVRRSGRGDAPYVPVESVEQAVVRRMRREVFTSERQRQIRQAVREYVEPRLQNAKREAERHQRRLRELTAEQQKLAQLYYRDLVSEEVLAAEQARIEQERADAQKWNKAAAREVTDVMTALDEALKLVDAKTSPYATASPTARRLLLQTIFERLIITEDGAEGLRTPLFRELHILADDLQETESQAAHTARSRRGSGTKNTDPLSEGRCSDFANMAEGAGFEPANDLRRLRFSRPVHSTALPPLRRGGGYLWRLGARRAFVRGLTVGGAGSVIAGVVAKAHGAW
jgi:site-specific DNA recombinase